MLTGVTATEKTALGPIMRISLGKIPSRARNMQLLDGTAVPTRKILMVLLRKKVKERLKNADIGCGREPQQTYIESLIISNRR
mmetsp:Transcript_17080/g.25659  ORF Transcript_17080/g.25659 Transcript_17080/m.25659 type:complete len:83 (-) Transcript_17080:127-375(-)